MYFIFIKLMIKYILLKYGNYLINYLKAAHMFSLFQPIIQTEIFQHLSIKDKLKMAATCKCFNKFLKNKMNGSLQIGNVEVTATKSPFDSTFPAYHVEVTINKEHNENSLNFGKEELADFLDIVNAIKTGPHALIEVIKQKRTMFNYDHYSKLATLLETTYAANHPPNARLRI